MPTICTVSGVLRDLQGNALAGAAVGFSRKGVGSQDGDVIIPYDVEVTANESGAVSFNIYPGNYTGVVSPVSGRVEEFTMAVPQVDAADIEDLIGGPGVDILTGLSVLETRLESETANRIASDNALASGDYHLGIWDSTTTASVFQTVSAGIAGVTDGQVFYVPEIGGYHFKFARAGTAAEFIGYAMLSSSAVLIDNAIKLVSGHYSDAPSDATILVPATAARSGGRTIENINATAAPTLNMISAFYPRDEEGNTTPARTVDADIDPLGNGQAVRLSYASTSNSFELYNRSSMLAFPVGWDVTLSARVKLQSGVSDLGLGSSSRTAGSYFEITPDGDWEEVTGVVADYSAATWDLTLIPTNAGGETLPLVVDAYGFFMGGASGPLTVPSLTDMRAEEMAGHAKATLAISGAIPVDTDGFVTPNGLFTNAVIPLMRQEHSSYTMGVWVDFTKADYSGAYAAALAFGNTPDTGTSTLFNSGALGMDTNSTRYGRIHMTPSYSDVVARCPTSLLNQGPTHLALRVTRGVGTAVSSELFLNGVPTFVAAETVAAFFPEVAFLGGYDGGRTRVQDGPTRMQAPDRVGDAVLIDRALTDAEISSIVTAGRLGVGDTAISRNLFIGSFDSLTAFSAAPFMQLWETTGIPTGSHFALDAVGGSRYGSGASNAYDNADRQGLRRRMLSQGVQHFDSVNWLCQYGTNDLVSSGAMDPNSGTWEAGRTTIDAMIAADIASVPSADRGKIRPILITIPAHGGWIAPGASAANAARDVARLAYNQDCRDNFASRGYAALLDVASYVPPSFASLELAAIDAFENGENDVYQLDGIHWSDSGGVDVADDLYAPFIAALPAIT